MNAATSASSSASTASRALAASGAVFAALAVALSAYAAHAAQDLAQQRLEHAAFFAFGHGIALAALARQAVGRLGVAALALLAVGTLLFSGSLVAAALFGLPTRLAPVGGSLMILAWLAYAASVLRR